MRQAWFRRRGGLAHRASSEEVSLEDWQSGFEMCCSRSFALFHLYSSHGTWRATAQNLKHYCNLLSTIPIEGRTAGCAHKRRSQSSP